MRLVHLSDPHLGYRQYQRLTPGGLNQREADIAKTFALAIDQVVSLAPELVLITGDLFHTVRPTNQAILHAFRQLDRLKRALPGSEIVLIAGNHDIPRSTETGGILQLFAQLGIRVVDREAKRLSIPELDLSVLAVPDAPGPLPDLKNRDSSARYNVLAMHGEVRGILPPHIAAADPAAVAVSREDLGVGGWNYVALGHHHVCTEIAPNAFYAGSLDYTSVDPWGELEQERVGGLTGKGIIEWDLDRGEHEFHAIPPARALIDLPRISARGLSVDEVNERIARAVDSVDDEGGIDDKIVRLMIRDLPRHIERELNHAALREFKRRAVNFQLDTRRPEPLRLQASGGPARRSTLLEFVRERLSARPLEPDIDREELIARALGYLAEAEATTVPVAAAGGEA